MSQKLKHNISITLLLAICVLPICCTKADPKPDKIPSNYEEMFEALHLQFNTTYKYVERINNSETGNHGTIKFSLSDTSMVETFNSRVTKDHFRLDSMMAYSAKFESLGFNKYNATQSVFINSARQSISFVDSLSMVSFGVTTNGSYYYYQYLLSK
ncbi:MAG TPA: hypothetical protein VFN95_07520 [Flavitalea sp.]|nr:hypothetical protein [Flavitalea sp.]